MPASSQPSPPPGRAPAAGQPPWAVGEPSGRGAPPWEVGSPSGPSSLSGQPPVQNQPPWPPAEPAMYQQNESAPSTGSLPAITGGLIRRQGTFAGHITRDGSSGFPAEPEIGRAHV